MVSAVIVMRYLDHIDAALEYRRNYELWCIRNTLARIRAAA